MNVEVELLLMKVSIWNSLSPIFFME